MNLHLNDEFLLFRRIATIFLVGALVIFSVDVNRLADFYEAVLSARRSPESSGDIRLFTDHEEVLVHSMTKSAAKKLVIATPPVARENSPFKPVFEVASLENALEQAQFNGGVVTTFTFTFDGLTRHDVLDPEGNVIQLRSQSL